MCDTAQRVFKYPYPDICTVNLQKLYILDIGNVIFLNKYIILKNNIAFFLGILLYILIKILILFHKEMNKEQSL